LLFTTRGGLQARSAAIHRGVRKASKGWCFKNLGSYGWLPGAPEWIQAFLETPPLWGELQ